MTNDELDAIRARDTTDYPTAEVLRKLAGVAGNGDPEMQATIDMIADRRALLAEVDWLREWQRRMVATAINTRLTRDEWYTAVAALIEEAHHA